MYLNGEFSLICRICGNSFSKNMVDKGVWQNNWIFIGICTFILVLGNYGRLKGLANKAMAD